MSQFPFNLVPRSLRVYIVLVNILAMSILLIPSSSILQEVNKIFGNNKKKTREFKILFIAYKLSE